MLKRPRSGATRLPALMAMLLIGVLCTACATQRAGHTFIYRPQPHAPEARTVHLAGSFNAWSVQQTPMKRDGDGAWSVTLDLPPGVHHYKFVVNQDTWLNDPASDKEHEVGDNFGGVNSAVLIGFDARDLPPAMPDAVNRDGVLHDPRDPEDMQAASRHLLVLSVRAQAGDAQRAFALIDDDATPGGSARVVELEKVGVERGLDRFKGIIPVEGTRVQYRIKLTDGVGVCVLPLAGTSYYTAEMTDGFTTPDWAKHAVWYQVFPERFRNGDPSNNPGAFPYENLVPWTSDWWATLPGERPGDEHFYHGTGNIWNRRYGGDIPGIQQALPYLRRLGINAIYLNPVFEAESMHKYDTADFRHVDDNFGVKRDNPFEGLPGETDDPATWRWSGSDLVFLEFLKEAHRQGFKVIIDGVFNHVGAAHPFFQDVLKNGPGSRYADWFEITDWGRPANYGNPRMYGRPGGIQWVAWDQPSGALPVFKKDPVLGLVPGPREHILAITRRWMDPDGDGDPSDGIDGWRLDVPGDIPHPFWIEWRKLVKSINPDAYITGEIWQWAHAWLAGDQFDATMNYPFAGAVQDFFIDQATAIMPSQFGTRLSELAYSYPMQVALVQQNLVASHDTDRFASMFVNPDRPYDAKNRIQDNGPAYDPRKPNDIERMRQRQALAFQMAFVGAPMIYYGDEAGMWGPDDPSNRMPMVWPDLGPYDGEGVGFDEGLFAWYQRCIAVRNALPVLRLGAYRTVYTEDDAGLIVFERMIGDERAWVIINRSDSAHELSLEVGPATDDAWMHDLLSDALGIGYDNDHPLERPHLTVNGDGHALPVVDGVVELAVPAYGVRILVDSLPVAD